MPGWLEDVGAWFQLALTVWLYVLVPILVLVGCFVYVKRSPHVNYGIGAQYEREGNLERAILYYRRAAHYGEGKLEARLAQTRLHELSDARAAARDEAEPDEA